MIVQLVCGFILIAITVFFQALAFDFIIKKTWWLEQTALRKVRDLWKAMILAIVVLAVSLTLIVAIWVWALFYMLIDAIQTLEEALYFSTSTFTTVGYGDLVLSEKWRLLSSIEAMDGFLLFGWSTAFIFEVGSRLYRKEGRAIET